jgi:hypothetical protein
MGRKKIETISQVHGKVEKIKPTSLEQMLGYTGLSKYKTLDETTYLSQIEGMNLADLQAHAVTVSLVPVDDRQLLTQRLLKEFRAYALRYNTPVPELKQQKKPTQKMLDILSQGR